MKKVLRIMVVLVLLTGLAACVQQRPAPLASSAWDQAIWDTATWQ